MMWERGKNMKYNLKSNDYSGKLIVFTGVDGAGKTTLLELCKDFLKQKNIEVYCTKMPSDRIRGMDVFRNFHDSKDEELRNAVDVFSLTVLACGDRLIVQDTEIIPALKQGKWVLCDRYCYTGNVRCRDYIIDEISEKFIQPDIAILADASPEVLKKRVMEREAEKNLFYDYKGVIEQRKKYLEIAGENNIMIINTERDLSNVKDELTTLLHKEICKWVYKKILLIITNTVGICTDKDISNCTFEELEIDSYKFISCIAAIEDEFQIVFSDEYLDYKKFNVVSDLIKASNALIEIKSE